VRGDLLRKQSDRCGDDGLHFGADLYEESSE